ncbi:methylthioadenosine nucleosidase /adenosylhomocysteine nucleosidase [Loktanella atrilutea]|uniref:Methylthioadenosine nucleosidase /adenosylhomocysteine nucleosidase n=1 Tax=Loktanella atrilutea TaxID=366533 RepID=A0A1M4Y897_LOKAT|nr:5'-methylthioadenosine/S-adenosylhomocysteine nucleosidase [Loktanella atrilutea]SHF01813.1 methylthioadenosine nucleosidase /adenosylhomocysteine nucleosidase [Loktanella atrilutea]
MHCPPVHAVRAPLALSLAILAAPLAAQEADTTHRTAIVSAFPPEIAALQDGLSDTATQTLNGVTFTTGQMEGQPVVMFMSGVSMVNAAMTTQLALDHFSIDRILFSGIAGGVDPDLAIGDVVVPGQWGQYLQGVAARDTDGAFAIPPWMTSEFPNFGMTFTVPFGVMADGLTEPDMRFWFPVDPDLLALAQTVAADVTLSDCTPERACLTEAPKIVVGGNGVSGPMFVDNADLRRHAFATFDAQVLDMESAAVAQVAFANDVPFIAFRSLSDLAGGGEGANEMGTFMALAATNAATVIRAVVAALD